MKNAFLLVGHSRSAKTQTLYWLKRNNGFPIKKWKIKISGHFFLIKTVANDVYDHNDTCGENTLLHYVRTVQNDNILLSFCPYTDGSHNSDLILETLKQRQFRIHFLLQKDCYHNFEAEQLLQDFGSIQYLDINMTENEQAEFLKKYIVENMDGDFKNNDSLVF